MTTLHILDGIILIIFIVLNVGFNKRYEDLNAFDPNRILEWLMYVINIIYFYNFIIGSLNVIEVLNNISLAL
jgi:hypothetical protein